MDRALNHNNQSCEFFLSLRITMLMPFLSHKMFTTKCSLSFEEPCCLFWRKKTQITPQLRYSLQQHFAHTAKSKSILMQNSSVLHISFTRNIT